jgi:hypothetical protein
VINRPMTPGFILLRTYIAVCRSISALILQLLYVTKLVPLCHFIQFIAKFFVVMLYVVLDRTYRYCLLDLKIKTLFISVHSLVIFATVEPRYIELHGV